MTEVQQTYTGMLKDLSGEEWKQDDTWKVGNAGVAVAVSVLDDGNLQLQHLKERLPDFSQSEIRMAISRLKSNGYFHYDRSAKEYRLVVSSDTSIEEGVFWAILANVANGFMKVAKQ